MQLETASDTVYAKALMPDCKKVCRSLHGTVCCTAFGMHVALHVVLLVTLYVACCIWYHIWCLYVLCNVACMWNCIQ